MVVIKEVSGAGAPESSAKMSFWGVTLDAGKKYSQVVEQSFQLTMAALEHNPGSNKEFVQLMLQHESQEFLLCTLQHGVLLQQKLDLVFMNGDKVSFSLNGSGSVHLTGYLLSPDDDESMFYDEAADPDFVMDGEEEGSSDDDDDNEAPDLVEAKGKKRKAIGQISTSKKQKMFIDEEAEDDDSDEDDDDDDDDDDEEEEDFSDDFGDLEFEEDDFDDDEEEEEEEDEDDEVEEESPSKSKKDSPGKKKSQTKQEASPGKKSKDPATPGSAKKGNVKKEEETPKQKKGKTPQKGEESSTASVETPTTNGDTESGKKKKKKKKKKNKDGDNSMVDESGDTSKTASPEKAGKKRVMAGGVVAEDIKVGHGPEAKPGKMASVYYVGTLAKNNKRFDSCQQGKPFRFRLNQGEVIKGWDTGVTGMKVGGKRKLMIPASQAYGNVRQGPIPANSALVFEVELKAVS